MAPAINGGCDGVNAYSTYNEMNVMDTLAGGIIATQDITDTNWDVTNNRLLNAATYVTSVTGPSYIKAKTNDVATLYSQDQTMLVEMKKEYCYYFHRYRVALTQLYTNITAASPPTNTQQVLTNTILLNRRVNALIEVMDYIANQRIGDINQRKAAIDASNEAITRDLPNLQSTADALKDENLIIKSQKEMIRYTQEKNNHIENQISLWAALNIVAIASIFYIYRRM